MTNDNPLPLDQMAIADHDAGSVAFVRKAANDLHDQARDISLDATLQAIRLQILTDEAQRAKVSPMRKLLHLAQTWMVRHYD